MRSLTSDAEANLSGTRKHDRLVARFGTDGFDYAAGGVPDLAIWSHAGAVVLVDAPPRVLEQIRGSTHLEAVFGSPPPRPVDYFKAMRLQQCLKNLLVLVPLALAHQLDQPMLLIQATLAFLAFRLCASSVYLLNEPPAGFLAPAGGRDGIRPPLRQRSQLRRCVSQ